MIENNFRFLPSLPEKENPYIEKCSIDRSSAYITRKILHKQTIGNQLTLSWNFRIIQFINDIQMFLTRHTIAGRLI